MKTDRPDGTIPTGFRPSIYCPKCGLPAAWVEYDSETGEAQYLHVLKKRVKRHSVKPEGPQKARQAGQT